MPWGPVQWRGPRIRMVPMTRPATLPTLRSLLGAALVALPLASCGGGASPDSTDSGSTGDGQASTQETSGKKKRPVILISIDSLRADFTTPYGHVPAFAPDEVTTPFLSKMAEKGVLFEHTSAASSWTLPSHITMLTGMAPMEHGIRSRKYSLHEGIDMISNVFQDDDYHTGGFFTAPFLHPAWGFQRGFDVYIPAADYLGTIEAGEALAAHGRSDTVEEIHSKSHTDNRTGEQAIDRAIGWLKHEDKYEEPFFLFVHLWDPHYDYFPPKEYRDRFLPMDSSVVGDELMKKDRLPSVEELEHLKALYEAEIRYTDDQIARLYAQLEEWGIAEDAIIAIVSDHGDEFMEHGNRGHHLTLLEEVIHVPMVIQAPGLIDGGQRIQGSVSIADLAPTLIDLAGLPGWPERSGKSMRPLWEVADVDYEVSLDLYRPTLKMNLMGYRKGMKKGIQDFRKNLLRIYDLEEDPKEMNATVANITAEDPFIQGLAKFILALKETPAPVHHVREAVEITNLLAEVGYVDE